MKNIFKLLILSILVASLLLTGCSSPLSPDDTKLTIKNNTTSTKINLVSWNGTYFGDDDIWDDVLNKYVKGINPGGSQSTREVSAGSGYIYFWFSTGGSEYRTSSSITVSEGESMTFTFTDSTSVVEN